MKEAHGLDGRTYWKARKLLREALPDWSHAETPEEREIAENVIRQVLVESRG